MPTAALTADAIFDGEAFLGPGTLVTEDGLIAEILPEGAPPPATDEHIDCRGQFLAPGFVDVQVNGGGGVMFNTEQSAQALARITEGHRRFGTTTLLPTVITDSPAVMQSAAAALRAALEAGVPGIGGIHFEGPCLNPARKGAHDAALMTGLTPEIEAIYTGPGLGRVLVTLAPEHLAPGDIARLAASGLRLSAGHTEADAAIIARAEADGLTGVTHLFNAMPPMAGRAPGPVGATLASPTLRAGLIADLVHVAPESARAALAALGPDRLMLVTDAMGTVGSDTKSFTLYGREIFERDGRCALADGTLAGSALDMMTSVRNTHRALGAPLEAALTMASLTPARFLGLDGQIGRLVPGARADIVAIDPAGLTVARCLQSPRPLDFTA